MKYLLPLALCALLLGSVSCGKDEVTTAPVFGDIEVVTVTTGSGFDGDGYTITVSAGDDERTENITTNSSVTFSNLTPGTKTLLLGDIALNCQTTDNPRDVEVVAGQTTPAQFDVTCAVPNLPPVADAGPDRSKVDLDNTGSEPVILDGSASTDVDGTIVSWSWSVNGAEFGTGETLEVSAAVGVHTVTLTVTDDEGATGTDDAVIIVVPTDGNRSPIADAGPNQPVLDADAGGSELVTLDGSGSTDLDGTVASWSWSENSVEIGTGETFDATFDVGIHLVTLTVTDDEAATGTDSLVVTVVSTGGNLPPIADAGVNQVWVDSDASGSTPVKLDGSGSYDYDGTIASWSWSEDSVEIGTGETLITQLSVGIHLVTLTVTDDGGATDTDEVRITVQLPTLTGVSLFESIDFNGNGFLVRSEISDLSELNTGPCANKWDNCASSISLSDGWYAILYEFDEFGGDSLIVLNSIVDLGFGDFDWDNRASSIRVRPPN